MTKVNRTLRMEEELSKKLDAICVRHGDITYHIERALSAYEPIKRLIELTPGPPESMTS